MSRCATLSFLFALVSISASAQDADARAQLPRLLRNAYFGLSVGSLDVPLDQRQLEPGFRAATIARSHLAPRATLFGREFGRYVAVEASYMRPVTYTSYSGIEGRPAGEGHHVRTTFGTATVRLRYPVGRRLFVYGETGFGLSSRTGFTIDGRQVVADAHHAALVTGGGVDLALSDHVTLTAGLLHVPGRASLAQPRALFPSVGGRYTMRALRPEQLAEVEREGAYFASQMVYAELSTGVGYGVNTFVSRKVPVFWGGNAKVNRGGAVHYERNVFHTKRVFSLDVGASGGVYRTREQGDRFHTLSVYPLLRFTFVRKPSAVVYFAYSLAGPTFISKTILDGYDTGRRFTFQDFMGVGAYLGAKRRLNVGVKINHYSNGNIFTQNAGVKIPLTYSLGYVF